MRLICLLVGTISGFLSLRRHDPDQVRRVTASVLGQTIELSVSQPLERGSPRNDNYSPKIPCKSQSDSSSIIPCRFRSPMGTEGYDGFGRIGG